MTESFRREIGCVAWAVGLLALIIGLHYTPIIQQKMRGRQLINERLADLYRASDFEIIRSSDYSNYAGLFNVAGLVPTGGNEEYWDFCLLVKSTKKNGSARTASYRAGGDRAYLEMKLRKAPNFKKCREDQAG